jgi:hypothetical protein
MKISDKQIINMIQLLQEYSKYREHIFIDQDAIKLIEQFRNQQSEELKEVE